MSNFVQVIGKLVSFDRGNYIFQVGNANIEIPDYKMFHFVTFPDHLMENGHLKTGSEIRLVKKDDQTYYPDRRHYEWMKRSTLSNSADGTHLLEDPAVKPYPVACDDFRTFTRDIATMMGNMNSADREMVLSLLMDSSKNEEEKKQEISKKGILPVNFVESESLEKKSSLFFPAGKGRTDASDKLKKEKNVQMIEIVETIASFANSKSPRPCQLIIGVDDKDRTTGLQNEIASRYPSMRTLDQFQSTYLVTMIKQLTYENASLLQSLAYNWYRLGKDLILVIDINYTGKPVLVKGGRLPYRSGSSKNVIEGTQLVDYILDYKTHNI